MPFPRRLLHETEELVLDMRPHVWFIAGPTTALVASLVVLVLVGAVWLVHSACGTSLRLSPGRTRLAVG